MLGYGQYSRSLNGIKTLSATDIEGQITTPQNNFQITDVVIDQNLQVDDTATLNQVYVDGVHLNAFISAVDDYFNDMGGGVTPVLSNIIYAGTIEYLNTVTFNNNNLQVVVGGDYISLNSNKLLLLNDVSGNIVSTDKANYYTATNQYSNQSFFNARVDFTEDVYIDKRFIINNPTDTDFVILTNTDLGKVRYLTNVTSDINTALTTINSSLSTKASLTSNTFTGLQNIYNTSTIIGSTPNLLLTQNTRTTLGFISSANTATYNPLTQENDAVIFVNDGLDGGTNLSGGIVIGSFYDQGIRISRDGQLNVGGGRVDLYEIYLKNALLLLTESMLSKIYYIRNMTTDLESTYATTSYVDTEIASAITPTYDGSTVSTITAPVGTDLVLSTATNTRKVVISYNLEVSGLSASDTTFTNKGRSVFEQNATFENKVILQNEQDLCLTGTFGSNYTFSTIKSIPKFTRILGGINITISTPPASGLNNGYEVTFIKYSSTAESQIISTTSCIYAKGSVTATINVFFSAGLTVMKFVVFNDAWYEI